MRCVPITYVFGKIRKPPVNAFRQPKTIRQSCKFRRRSRTDKDLGKVGARKVGPGYERDVMHVSFVYLAELRSRRDDPSLTLLPPPFHQP